MGVGVHLKRRSFLMGVLSVGAIPTMASSAQQAGKSKRVVEIRSGFYSVDGLVVNKQELRTMQKEGLC